MTRSRKPPVGSSRLEASPSASQADRKVCYRSLCLVILSYCGQICNLFPLTGWRAVTYHLKMYHSEAWDQCTKKRAAAKKKTTAACVGASHELGVLCAAVYLLADTKRSTNIMAAKKEVQVAREMANTSVCFFDLLTSGILAQVTRVLWLVISDLWPVTYHLYQFILECQPFNIVSGSWSSSNFHLIICPNFFYLVLTIHLCVVSFYFFIFN